MEARLKVETTRSVVLFFLLLSQEDWGRYDVQIAKVENFGQRKGGQHRPMCKKQGSSRGERLPDMKYTSLWGRMTGNSPEGGPAGEHR